jgi:hypothetical protein
MHKKLIEKQKIKFLSKFKQGSSDECWETFDHGRRSRFAYVYFIGPIPEGMLICHKCDNPSCVNPNHLFLGTDKDNSQDMIKKGRYIIGDHNGEKNGMFGVHRYGEKNPMAKLNWEKVNEIRNSNLTNKELAEKFNVTKGQIFTYKMF